MITLSFPDFLLGLPAGLPAQEGTAHRSQTISSRVTLLEFPMSGNLQTRNIFLS